MPIPYGSWFNNVRWTKIEDIGCFLMPLLLPYHLYVSSKEIFWHLTLMKPRILIKNFKSFSKTSKTSGTSLKFFPFIYSFFFERPKFHHFSIDVETPLQRVGVGYSICWQRENLIDCKWIMIVRYCFHS